MRVNGLYGHVRSNNTRSLALFAGFVAAFQLLAALALLVPLAMLDPDHAPIFGWAGYCTRWVPIATVAGALLFAGQMFWHVNVVRRRTDFRFVDDADEPRLCRIVEPLTIAAGLPTPYVGVIDSAALNAFACGIWRKDAVLVFTRGLIDGLDDEELAAVAAHEISHIVNGDIRLMAATNVCLDTLALLTRRRQKRNRGSEVLSLPVLAWILPLMAVLIVAVIVLRQLAINGSHLTRRLIASAREFIADAEAVRLTQNPAALVSALRRIEGRSTLPDLAAGHEAMMIDGAHEGLSATHPAIDDRIAAIISVTGSMALNAPARRRDTRAPAFRAEQASFGRRAAGLRTSSASRDVTATLAHVFGEDDANRFGFTRELMAGFYLALMAFAALHWADLSNPSALAKAFDPSPLRTFFEMAGKGVTCQLRGTGALIGVAGKPTDCGMEEMGRIISRHGGMERMIGGAPAFVHMKEGMAHASSDDRLGGMASQADQLSAIHRDRCFQTEPYTVGDRGLHPVTEQPGISDGFSLPRWLAADDAAARSVITSSGNKRDAALLDYARLRKTHGETIHRYFGDSGISTANAHYADGPNADAVAILRQRLADRRFSTNLGAMEHAELQLLAERPTDFVSCIKRQETGSNKSS